MNLFESSYCLTLSLAAGLKQPYTDSLPLVDGLSPPQQPQRDIQYRAACRVFFLLIIQGLESAALRYLTDPCGNLPDRAPFRIGCWLTPSGKHLLAVLQCLWQLPVADAGD